MDYLKSTRRMNIPLRPILSAIGTHNYSLAKYLTDIIKPVSNSKNQYSAKDTFDFISRISNAEDANKYMVSFDVESLFNNVPLIEVIDICVARLYHTQEYTPPKLPEEVFKSLLQMVTSDTYFLFNGDLYKQLDGVAMGSPLGPVLANTFLAHLEDQYFTQSPLFPKFYVRYVDDTFCIFDNKDKVLPFKEFVNSVHPNITFTVEEEKLGILAFLDTEVHHTAPNSEKQYELSVHRKSVYTGLYFHFSAYMPLAYKINLIKTLIHRIYNICSTRDIFHGQIEKLKTYLSKNCFPSGLVKKCIQEVVNKLSLGKPDPSYDVPKKECRIILPYLGVDSFRIKQQIKKTFSALPCVKVQVIFSCKNRIRNMFRVKDFIPKLWSSHVVYKINCDSCNEFYIGKTINTLYERFHTGKNSGHLHPENVTLHC